MREKKRSWFNDPEWEELHRRVSRRGALKPEAPSGVEGISAKKSAPKPRFEPVKKDPEPISEARSDKKTVSVSIELPKFSIRKPALSRPSPKQKKILLRVGIVATVILVINALALTFIKDKKDPGATQGVTTQATQPEFPVVLPDGSKQGLTNENINYDPVKKVASYKDTLQGIDITVSQQPLPEAFKSDPAVQVEKIAKDFSADKALPTKSTKAFVGTSAQGPQSVVTWKKGVLIFIFANREIKDEEWVSYIDSFQ